VYSQKKLSSVFQTDRTRTIIEAAILFGLGMLAVVLHNILRMPMQLPGKQGVIWIAILVAGRCSSRLGIAGSMTGSGAAIASLSFTGHGDPFDWAVYMTAGFASDFIFGGIPQSKIGMALLTVTFGMIHVLKPVIRYFMGIYTGIPHKSIITGMTYPVFTHFVFGLIGAVLGILMAKGVLKSRGMSQHER
jgi:hypothetical protein